MISLTFILFQPQINPYPQTYMYIAQYCITDHNQFLFQLSKSKCPPTSCNKSHTLLQIPSIKIIFQNALFIKLI